MPFATTDDRGSNRSSSGDRDALSTPRPSTPGQSSFNSGDRPISQDIPGLGTFFLRRDRYLCKRRRPFVKLGRSQRAKVTRLAYLAVESVCDAFCPGQGMDLLDAIVDLHRAKQYKYKGGSFTSSSPSSYDRGSARPDTSSNTISSVHGLMCNGVSAREAMNPQRLQFSDDSGEDGIPNDDGPLMKRLCTMDPGRHSSKDYGHCRHWSGRQDRHHSMTGALFVDNYCGRSNSSPVSPSTSSTTSIQYDMIPPSPYQTAQLQPLIPQPTNRSNHLYVGLGDPRPLCPPGPTTAAGKISMFPGPSKSRSGPTSNTSSSGTAVAAATSTTKAMAIPHLKEAGILQSLKLRTGFR